MRCLGLVAVILFTAIAEVSLAAPVSFPAQGRVFGGVINADPAGINQDMKTLGLKEFKPVAKFGAEIAYPLLPIFSVGLRYAKINMKNLEVTPTGGSDYNATLDQDAVYGIARVSLIKSKFLRVDVFGGVGGANTTLTVKTASQSGELARKEANNWFGSVVSTYGASVGLGWENFFAFLEGGMDSNKVDSMKMTGNLTTSVRGMDLSGGYVAIGILFDGVPVTSK